MDPLEESRRRLESQVNEFFNPSTSNDRKQQIGTLLENFSKQSGSWKQALYFLSRPESFFNEFLLMYCITVVENSVKSRWIVMSPQERAELQSTLYSFLMQHAAAPKCPHFIRSKLVKILADVGKFSWPQTHPEFLDNVLKITANDETVMIGLLFLKIISEEWSTCRDEISTDRKLELKILLIRELKKIFDLLHQILVAGLKHYLAVSYTKPGESAQHLNPGMKEVLALALETCAHYFTWIPLDGTFPVPEFMGQQQSLQKCVPFSPQFVTTLCQYAVVDMSTSNEPDGIENLSILGINALNELLYRKYVPKELDEHVRVVTNFAVDMLCKMFTGISSKTVCNKYLDKGIEFMCLIASTYFFRYDKESSHQFTTLLLNFTFAQTNALLYYECLEIWKLILDHLLSEVPFANFSSRDDLLDNLKPVLLDLALGIVNSTTKFEIPDSEEYFDDEEDEDVETHSLSKNVDVLVKIGAILPVESLERMTSTWSTSCHYFENLQSKLNQNKTEVLLENQTDVKHFSFVVQLIGRIADIFYGEVFKNELDRGKALMNQLVGLLMISRNFYFVRSPEVIITANCEIIYAIRTWIYWLGRYYSEVILADATSEETSHFYEIIDVVTDGLRFTLDNLSTIHPSIILAQANFFALTVNCIRSKLIFMLPWVQTLIEKLHSLRNSVQPDTYRVLNKSLAILLLVPWQNASTSGQDWELRTKLYNSYMKNVMEEMLASANNNDAPNLILSIRILNDQLEVIQMESAVSKKICWAVYQEIVQFQHKLFPIYIKRPDVSEEILNFFLKVMEVLRQQVGAQFFEDTVRICLGLFTSENIINDLMKDAESSAIVVEKFLKMLEFMMKDPAASFKKFLPDCLSVALDHIYPVLAERTSPDVKIVFFQFIRDTLNFRWNYFFSGFIYSAPSSSHSGASPPSVNNDLAEANRRLYQMFQTIGQSFLQSDLEVFRFNLNTLSVWNQKHQIYSRISIDLKMFDGFMSVLLQVLASKSHELLKEEIAFNLYEMSVIDFPRFWQVFIPTTLQKDFPSLTEEQRQSLQNKFKPKESPSSSSSLQRDKIDLASFSMTLYRFVDDLRFYHFLGECVKNSGGGEINQGGSS